MPQPPVTFAFSRRQDRWTTRYSFAPTCYANCGDVMLSSKDAFGIWRHDVNENRNNFYGAQRGSSLNVVSNEDPSAVKTFKAVSLETNQKGWTATFFTNEEHQDKNKQQTKTVYGFEDKEGFKYLEVPRDTLNSTENIHPCPSLYLTGLTSEEITSQVVEGSSSGLTYSVNFSLGSGPLNVSVPNGKLMCVKNGELVGFPSFAVAPGTNLSDLYISNFVENTAEINTQSWNTSAFPTEGFVSLLDSFISYPLFIVSEASVNGDQMRGPYVRVELSLLTNKPLELHAVNVDYEFSKLDKRLTQNP